MNTSEQRILIADDSDDLLEMWHHLLCRDAQYCCALAHDGQAAVELYDAARHSDNPFALLLLDVMMPELNGFQVAEYVRFTAGDAETKIVIVTGMPDELTDARARYVHAVEVWRKPVESAEFKRRVEYLVSERLAEWSLYPTSPVGKVS